MKYRKIAINFLYRIGFNFLGKVINFITIPIITRSLGTEGYGTFNLALTIAAYAFLPANWGFLAKGIREIADENAKYTLIVNELLSARIVLTMLGGFVTIIISGIIFWNQPLLIYIIIAVLSNLWLSVNINYYYYATKNTIIPSLAHFISQLCLLFIIIGYSDNKLTVLYLLIFTFLIHFIESMILIGLYSKKTLLKIKLSVKKSILFLYNNFNLGLGSKATYFLDTFPVFIISAMLGKHELGIYSASMKFLMLIILVVQTLNLVLSPWIVKSKHLIKEKRIKLFSVIAATHLMIGLCGTLVMLIISKYFATDILGENFVGVKPVMNLIALTLLPIWSIYSFSSSYMNYLKLDKAFLYGGILMMSLIVTICPLLAKQLYLKGVICSMFIACTTATVYNLFKIYSNISKENEDDKKMSFDKLKTLQMTKR